MKKIHKKIGSMALAGMVVAGGVAASGVRSHAASLISELPSASVSIVGLDRLSNVDKWSVIDAQEIGKRAGKSVRVRAVSKSKAVMDKFIEDGKVIKKPSVRKKLLAPSVLYANANVLEKELKKEKARGEKVFRCRYDDLEFLFFL